ncbi:sulfur carrier protein ThiS [[Enterobacter] lignolyticus]|uniref:Thiamine biosynthesis protein ThiS n=1 Tax=Enterobacter lignolyticus (strain SCF1) TaxID=701347 RepID=E3G352_ENTLS|nr:sulfur carrier protein ThiS [[Enterobacter] lignolyticus]ADO50401.1 thiamine biosynthesis protein ThiS [[Enterobacter] lignolyticus SCF1]
MRIIVNEESVECSSALSVSALLTQLQLLRPGMALALNQQILPRAQWDEQLLQDGDAILLFQVIAGG